VHIELPIFNKVKITRIPGKIFSDIYLLYSFRFIILEDIMSTAVLYNSHSQARSPVPGSLGKKTRKKMPPFAYKRRHLHPPFWANEPRTDQRVKACMKMDSKHRSLYRMDSLIYTGLPTSLAAPKSKYTVYSGSAGQ
jgi:hypothetical protein